MATNSTFLDLINGILTDAVNTVSVLVPTSSGSPSRIISALSLIFFSDQLSPTGSKVILPLNTTTLNGLTFSTLLACVFSIQETLSYFNVALL